MIAVALSDLPTLNAALNAASACCVLVALHRIRRRRIAEHRRWMLTAVALSACFLVSYLVYHGSGQSRRFEAEGWVRTAYLVLLASHVVLAALIVPLVATTVVLGLKDRRATHRRIARWTVPLWLYVSVTGVLVYFAVHVWQGPVAGR